MNAPAILYRHPDGLRALADKLRELADSMGGAK